MSKKYRRNHQIRSNEVRLISEDGQQKGIVSLSQAIKEAQSKGLDLVEVSPGAKPPVCKLLDWGKFKYEQEKQAQLQKKKQKNVTVKEMRLSSKIEKHDLETKAKQTRKFLEKGNKVKVSLFLKGREIMHKDIGKQVLKDFQSQLEDVGDIEQDIKFMGREISLVLVPKK